MASPFDGGLRKAQRLATGLAAGALAAAGAPERAHAEVIENDLGTEVSVEVPEWLGDLSFDYAVPLVNPTDGSFDLADTARLLEPAYLVIGRERTAPRTVSFVVPYEYARFFDSGNPLAPEDYDRVKAFMAEEIRRQFADNVAGLSWDKNDYDQRFGVDPSQLIVDHISIRATTSPEAVGVESIAPDNVDEPNKELGGFRAEDGLVRVTDVLGESGFDVSHMSEDLSWDELQFSRAEYERLYELAQAAGKNGTPEEMMYRLISDYNFDRITDAGMMSELDQIVGSKRTVEVEITFQEGEKDRALIPLPLLLMLLLRRKPGPEEYGEPIGPKREPLDTKGPEELKPGSEYSKDVVVDIERNFYFYLPIVDRYISKENPDVNEMAHDILDRWNTHDNAVRERLGQQPKDHRDRPEQLLYAYLHALALQRVMREMKASGPNAPASGAWNSEKTKGLVVQDVEDHIERLQKWRTSPFNPDNKK